MNEKPENETHLKRRPPVGRLLAAAAAILALIQACLTIEGRGIEGFVLWVIILFLFYWLLFSFLAWLWQRYSDRS
jgi:fatty acid desaturase